MASHRVTAEQVVGMLFESSSDHDYETDSASEAEEEVRDSGSEFSVREYSSSADEGPVLEEDIDVPRVQQPGAEGFPIRRPDTWIAPNMEQPQLPPFTGLPGCRVNTENFLPESVIESLFVVERARVPRVEVVEEVARLKVRHFPDHIPPTPKKDLPPKEM
ncbi:hypothetical protein NDU88_001098 [Pleurodeles waltl]|uniref:Uncharacterized protein n=1 Tax=Pleurodeles waltl TaxID=8319 RepID=A0AAV7VVE9_PLEWA|nr:hypothetical protein NDU88_001098 [Pleurodeles waltl]